MWVLALQASAVIWFYFGGFDTSDPVLLFWVWGTSAIILLGTISDILKYKLRLKKLQADQAKEEGQ